MLEIDSIYNDPKLRWEADYHDSKVVFKCSGNCSALVLMVNVSRIPVTIHVDGQTEVLDGYGSLLCNVDDSITIPQTGNDAPGNGYYIVRKINHS